VTATFLHAYWLALISLALLLAARSLLTRYTAPATRTAGARLALAREICLFVAAYLVYFCVRGLAKERVELAYVHAHAVLRFERRLGIAWEASVQGVTLRTDVLVDVANWIYIWLFWPLLTVVFVWLFQCHRSQYALYRNAMLISGALGLLLFLTFPVAPPRFLNDQGFIDTVGNRSTTYQLLLPHALANLYAAMPSLHAGWLLIAGVSLARNAGARAWRVVGYLLPLAMFISIVATANHYIVDGLVGWLVAIVALATARLASQRWPDYLRAGVAVEREQAPTSALTG
jgi:hypothetical protein